MALKNLDQLYSEIDLAVHPGGPQGETKTTAAGLSGVLKILAVELTTLPQEAALAAARKADLDASGRVPSDQLPGYVDDVLEAATFKALPSPGEAGKLYVALDTNAVYRWSGTQYVAIGTGGMPPPLYPTTGQNTDGAMTQKAITDALSGVLDLTTNKAVLVRADRSKVFYTGNGTAEQANANDAVVRAFADAAPGDYVYITAPVNMPNAGYYAPLCVIKGGTNVNLGGYPITTINRQDCLGVAEPGSGTVYGYGSLLTAVGPGSYGLNVTPAAVGANYQLLNVNFRGTGPGSGVLVRGGNYYHEGRIEILGSGTGIVVAGKGSFGYEFGGDLSVAGTGTGFRIDANSKLTLRNGRASLQTAGSALGELLDSAALEIERYVLDLTQRPTGGISCLAGTTRVTLTDVTVLGGSVIAAGNGATLVLRGSTTLPTAYEATYLRGLGLTIIDERPGGAATAAVSGIAAAVPAPAACLCVANGAADGHAPTQFATLALTNLVLERKPAGTAGGFDPNTHEYTAPVGGVYEATGKLRILDNAVGPGQSYGLGVGPVNEDGYWFQWYVGTGGAPTNRNGAFHQRMLHLNAGDKIRFYAYFDGFSAAYGAELSVALLAPDA